MANNLIKLTDKQMAFAVYYATPGSETEGNGLQSAKRAAYKGNNKTLSAVAAENLRKPGIKAEVDKIKAKIAKKLEHNRETAIKMLTDSLTYLEEEVSKGNVQAINARTAIIRELSAISNLHSNTTNVNTSNKDIPQSEKEIEAGEAAAATFKLKIANG